MVQRSGATADISISGTYSGSPAAIEAWYAGSWTTIDAAPSGGTYSGTLIAQPTGSCMLAVRFTNDHSKCTWHDFVSVGDVYVIAGQSNAVGRATVYEDFEATYQVAGGILDSDGTWRPLGNPIDMDAGGDSGSVWPYVVNGAIATGVPIGLIPCAVGGSSIYEWEPSDPYYTDMVSLASGGAKAVLLWIGESNTNLSEAAFNSALDNLANQINTDLSIPTVVCKIENVSYLDETNVNAAIATAWADNANVLQGPDFSAVTFDGDIHYTSQSDMDIAGPTWWAAVEALFY